MKIIGLALAGHSFRTTKHKKAKEYDNSLTDLVNLIIAETKAKSKVEFEDIPEDKKQSFPCPNECGGNVTQDKNQGNMWQCDNCDWMPPQKETD